VSNATKASEVMVMTKQLLNRLYIDQYGNKFYAATLKALRSQIANGNSRVSIMYMDSALHGTMRTGYVIGQHWLTEYVATVRKVA
jgi:hypothetical protein